LQIKRPFTSFGTNIFIITVISAAFFVNWALGPLTYEKAQMKENLGHQLTRQGKNNQAYKAFLSAAEIQDDVISRSRRYRCAGTVISDFREKLRLFDLSLKFNKTNTNAIKELKNLIPKISIKDIGLLDETILHLILSTDEIIYFNRYPDEWSIGYEAGAVINVRDSSQYLIEYFSSTPRKDPLTVSLSINDNPHLAYKIVSSKAYKSSLKLSKGINRVSIKIDKTFNPKILGMSADSRDLGVHFKIIKAGNITK